MSKSKTLVNKATSDNRQPPTGYILQELAQKTRSVEECRVIEELILKKLDKNKPYVKFKALRVIKYICNHGSPQWRREWQRHTDKIRACAQFRGPADPVYGDSPYEDVRSMAKETMTAIFASTQMDNTEVKKRIQGHSGDSARGGYEPRKTSTFESGKIGVTNIRTPNIHTAPRRTNSGMRNEWMSNTDYVPSGKTFQPVKQSAPYANPAQFSSKNPYATRKLDNRHGRSGHRKKGQVGGRWADSDESEHEMPFEDDEFPSEDIPRSKKITRSDGTFERQWVESVTSGGGVGVKIHDLKQRVQQFETLSQSHVLEFLDTRLADDSSWQARAKALTLIEALLKGNSAQAVAEYFEASPENLQDLINSRKTILRKKANAICDTIGVSEDDIPDTGNNTTTVEPEVGTVEAEQDLLDMGMDQPVAPVAQEEDDLFGALNVVNNTEDVVTAVVAPVKAAPPPVVEKAKEEVPDFFADLMNTPDEPPSTANDVLSFMTTTQAPPTTLPHSHTPVVQQPPSQGSFDFVHAAPPIPAVQQPPANSGFSFISGAAPGHAQAPPQTMTAFQMMSGMQASVNQIQAQHAANMQLMRGMQTAMQTNPPQTAFPSFNISQPSGFNQRVTGFPNKNDPFAGMLQQQQAPAVPQRKKPEKDPFADLGGIIKM